ncbi:MAG: MliC family protein [Rhodanobacter sp.]
MTTAKPVTYICGDGRTLQAVYPNTNSVVLTLDGQTHLLHIARSADGARYVDDHWQWWTKGLHQGQLATLEAGEAVASAAGIVCTAP